MNLKLCSQCIWGGGGGRDFDALTVPLYIHTMHLSIMRLRVEVVLLLAHENVLMVVGSH